MFWENYVRLCNSENKSPNAVAAENGVKSSGTVTGWKNGVIPRAPVLQKLADYFNVTTAELLGESIPAAGAGAEADRRLLDAYHSAPPDLQAAVRRVLGLE